MVRTRDSAGNMSAYKTIGTNEVKTWGGNDLNVFPGDFRIIMRRQNWAVTTAKHSGTWILDKSYLGII